MKELLELERRLTKWIECALWCAIVCLTGALILMAQGASAADGAVYTGGGFTTSPTQAPAWKVLLCDSKTATEVCLSGVGLSPPVGYTSGQVNFEIAKDTGCSSCSVEIRIGSGTDEKHLIDTLTCGGHTSGTLPKGVGVAGKIFGEVVAIAGCTDLDVVVHAGMEK